MQENSEHNQSGGGLFYVTSFSKVTELIVVIKNRARSASGRVRGKERRSLSRPVSPFRKLSLAVKAGLA